MINSETSVPLWIPCTADTHTRTRNKYQLTLFNIDIAYIKRDEFIYIF